jgi:hypothetical protein
MKLPFAASGMPRDVIAANLALSAKAAHRLGRAFSSPCKRPPISGLDGRS